MSLLGRSVFGDLFLSDPAGQVFWLQVDIGKFTQVANSESEFLELAQTEQKQQEWFAAAGEQAAASNGLVPTSDQCIGFSVPVVLAVATGRPNRPYVADIYEVVSFLGDINRQIADLPDGAQIQLRIEPEPGSAL